MAACLLSLVPAAPPVRCNARDYLERAERAHTARFYAEAGCLLREGIRQTLLAWVEYADVTLPRRKVRRSTGELAILLKPAGAFDETCCNWVLELIETGNLAAHCAFVGVADLAAAIREAGYLLDDAPFAEGGVV